MKRLLSIVLVIVIATLSSTYALASEVREPTEVTTSIEEESTVKTSFDYSVHEPVTRNFYEELDEKPKQFADKLGESLTNTAAFFKKIAEKFKVVVDALVDFFNSIGNRIFNSQKG